MAEWIKQRPSEARPITILIIPEPDEDGHVKVRHLQLERLLSEAGYSFVGKESRIHV